MPFVTPRKCLQQMTETECSKAITQTETMTLPSHAPGENAYSSVHIHTFASQIECQPQNRNFVIFDPRIPPPAFQLIRLHTY